MLSVCHKHMSWCHRAVDARLSSLLVLPVTCSSRQRAGCFSKVSIFKCLPCGGKLMTQAQMFLQTWKACESKDFFCLFFPFLRNYLPFEKQKFLWAVQLQHLKNQPYAAPGGLDSFLVVSSVGHQPDCIFYSLLFTSYIFRFLLTLIKFSFSKTGQFCSCGFSPYARVTNKKKKIHSSCISYIYKYLIHAFLLSDFDMEQHTLVLKWVYWIPVIATQLPLRNWNTSVHRFFLLYTLNLCCQGTCLWVKALVKGQRVILPVNLTSRLLITILTSLDNQK